MLRSNNIHNLLSLRRLIMSRHTEIETSAHQYYEDVALDGIKYIIDVLI